MLKLIFLEEFLELFSKNLNTSHVKVNLLSLIFLSIDNNI